MADDREGVAGQDRPAQRRRHALPGGPVPPLHATRSTPTSAWSSPPSSTSPSSAATPTTSSIPRYDLDVCFFRVYEDDKPAKLEHYLKWSADGRKDGDLIFVAGHPGRTSRLNTVAHLEYLRDVALPAPARHCSTTARRSCSNTASGAPSRPGRRKDELFGDQNSRKARMGGLEGLQDPALMGRKAEAESEPARAGSRPTPSKQDAYGDAWDKIADAQKVAAEISEPLQLPRARARPSTRSSSASPGRLVRLAEENGQAERRPAPRVPRRRPRVARS